MSWLVVQWAYIVLCTLGVAAIVTLNDQSEVALGEVLPWSALATCVLAAPTLIVSVVFCRPLEPRSALVAAFPCGCLLLASGVLASPFGAIAAISLPIVGPFVLALLCLILAVSGSVFGAVGLARGW